MSLSALFSRLKQHHILVIGDFMMDSYTIGSVNRVSPEAPVIVVNAQKEELLPGGAGNVVLNLVSLGAKVTALGRMGNDAMKDKLLDALKKEKVNTHHMVVQKGYKTPIKNRVIAGNQQIVRVDFEEKEPLSTSLENHIINELPQILKTVSVVAVSDYAKGFLTRKILSSLMIEANKLNVPVIVDPKGCDFQKYQGAFLIKPNVSEAYQASGFDQSIPLEVVASKIFQEAKIQHLMVTRSSKGITLFHESQRQDFPVKVKEVTDVTGAGDTVLAVLTFALSNKIPLDQAAVLCNLAAAEVIEHMGCARISIKTLAELILTQHLDNKVFSKSYLQVLQFILDHEDFILVRMSLENYLTPRFFFQIKELKKQFAKCKIVAYLENEPQDESLIDLLASLHEIDFIIKKVDSLQKFCERHAPKKIFTLDEEVLTEQKSLSSLISS